jgi:nitrate/TMAO reductase-like tetraheme cytochrome c subunit
MSIMTFIKSGAAITLVIGLVVGIVATGATNVVLHETSDTEFCVSCHVYEEFYPEFQGSVHQANASGVQAECESCHIPHDSFINRVVHKTRSGLRDMWAYYVEGIDTPAELEEIRAGLAEKVWAYYLENDSQQCRSCHNPDGWDYEAQSVAAATVHKQAVEQGQTCIQCHQGIAHSIPEGATFPPEQE